MSYSPPIRVNVAEMPSTERQSLEQLVGHALDEDERVCIFVYKAGIVPDAETRRQAREALQQTFAKTAAYALTHEITDDEIDAAVDEAIERV